MTLAIVVRRSGERTRFPAESTHKYVAARPTAAILLHLLLLRDFYKTSHCMLDSDRLSILHALRRSGSWLGGMREQALNEQ